MVVAHLGRPKGEVKAELSLAPVATRMAELLGAPVDLAPAGAILPAHRAGWCSWRTSGSMRETSKDPAERGALAAELANGMDAYVSDGFGVLHREQARCDRCREAAAQRRGSTRREGDPVRRGPAGIPPVPTAWCWVGRRSPTNSA